MMLYYTAVSVFVVFDFCVLMCVLKAPTRVIAG